MTMMTGTIRQSVGDSVCTTVEGFYENGTNVEHYCKEVLFCFFHVDCSNSEALDTMALEHLYRTCQSYAL